jgi:predicted dehydrogenase
MSDRMLKVAVVGVGLHGENHALVYADHPATELVAVCDSDRDRAERVADRYGCAAAATLDEIAASDVDAVSVATPDHLHHDVVATLLRAGKHVLCEKPLTTSTEEAADLVRLAEGAGLRLAVNFAQRFNPRWTAAKEAILRGDVGTPVTGRARIVNTISVPGGMLRWSGASGPEWFILPHIADVTCWLLDREPVEVFAYGSKEVLASRGIDAYDAIQALVRFGDPSPYVAFETAWILPATGPAVTEGSVSLVGTGGRIEVDNTDRSVELHGRERASYLGTIPLARRNYHGKVAGFYFDAIRAFADDLLGGETTVASGRAGLRVTALVEAIRRSIESGEKQRVDGVLREEKACRR